MMTTLLDAEEQLVTLRYDLLTPLTGVLAASRLLTQIDQPTPACVRTMTTIHAAAERLVNQMHTLLAEYGVFGQRLLNKPIASTPERAEQEARYPWAWSLPLGPMAEYLIAEMQIEISRIGDAAQLFEQEYLVSTSPQGAEIFRVLSDCFHRIVGTVDTLPNLLQLLILEVVRTTDQVGDPASNT